MSSGNGLYFSAVASDETPESCHRKERRKADVITNKFIKDYIFNDLIFRKIYKTL